MDIKKPFESYSDKANSPEAERVFRETCSLHERQCSDFNQPLIQHYQEYLNYYHKKTSLYLVNQEMNQTKLFIYDTERETKEERILDTSESLNVGTCITQLPNGDLFCFGADSPVFGITLIIDMSYRVRILPFGKPCTSSSGIYFNNNVYCFGGYDKKLWYLALSSKFDLNQNRWINLTQMPQADYNCHSVIINENILISGYHNRNIFLYTIGINSFSTIPFEFGEDTRKILINIDRLYLIECGWNRLIYESEDAYDWKIISKSVVSDYSYQLYYSYNKGGIYIGIVSADNENWALYKIYYYKFDLNKKVMIQLQ